MESSVLMLATSVMFAAAVPTVKLRNDVEMPLLAAGSWKYDTNTAEESATKAIKAGFTMIDTAYDYYNQVGIGRAIRSSGVKRESIFLVTKVPGCGFDSTSVYSCYNDTKRILQKNLDLLNLSYVDLVTIHTPPSVALVMRSCHFFTCGEIVDQWRAMEEFYVAGKARAIGVSNYCESCFACLEKANVYPMVNQISYHMGMGPDPSGFKSFAEKHGVVIQGYSVLGNNFSAQGPHQEILHGEFTNKLAKAHNKSTVQVALKWHMQHGTPAVTKSNNIEHLKSDLDLWSWNFSDGEMEEADKWVWADKPSYACDYANNEVVI